MNWKKGRRTERTRMYMSYNVDSVFRVKDDVRYQSHGDSGDALRDPKTGELLATVTVSVGQTVNMGDFEAAKISVGVTIPVEYSQLELGYQEALGFCEAKVQEQLTDLEKVRHPSASNGGGDY